MDPSDLRAGLSDRLAETGPLNAETFNAACFMLSRSLEAIELAVPEAAPLVRCLLRVAGRVVIDTGGPPAAVEVWPNTEEMALRWIDEALRALGYEVKPVEGAGRAALDRPAL